MQIFHEDRDRIYYANPYHHESKDTEVVKRGMERGSELELEDISFHRLIEPYIADETNSFYSKTFFIRYAEELVVLRDIIKFRTEVEVKDGYLNNEFFLKAELFYQAPPTSNFSRCVSDPKAMKEVL